MNSSTRRPSPFAALCVAAILALAGCAAPPPPKKAGPQTFFYPSLPDPPRIQWLATFDRARSVSEQRSGLADFVLGEEKAGEALERPYGATLHEGKIIVADSRAPGLVTFDLVGRRYSVFSGTGSGRMQRPINVKVDSDGTKFVTDTGRNQVLVFDRADRFLNAFGAKGEFKPVDTATVGDVLYVVDIEHHQVVAMDKRTGQTKFRFGQPGSAPGSLYHPTNIAVGPTGDLFVVETGNFRVSRFTPDGKFVQLFGEAGQTHGRFARPKGIAIDRTGRIFVGDAAFQNVQVFDAEGRPLMAFGQPGDGSQGLNLPAGVSIDYANVGLFQRFADPNFTVEYVILVVSQFGPNKVDVFGFGQMRGVKYPTDEPSAPKPGG